MLHIRHNKFIKNAQVHDMKTDENKNTNFLAVIMSSSRTIFESDKIVIHYSFMEFTYDEMAVSTYIKHI